LERIAQPRYIVEANHDYLIAVKENQPTLCTTIEQKVENCLALSEITVQDNSHGRQARRLWANQVDTIFALLL
jgi:hypothetical protein